jgi:hypothetical protein
VKTLDPFAHDDGAYVLGALSADERAAFEQHLATCPACTDRVRELASLPAMLAGLPAGAYADVQGGPPATLLPDLLRHVRSERRRRQWLTTGLAGLAAACIVALAVIAWPTSHTSAPHPGARPQAMSPVSVSTSLHATAALTAVNWGTQIRLECRYNAADTPSVDYQLVVFDKHNAAHPAGSWKLIPGKVTHFTGGTALPRDQISRVEIAVGDRPILQLRL